MEFARVLLVAILLFGLMFIFFGGEFVEERERVIIPSGERPSEKEPSIEPAIEFFVGSQEIEDFKYTEINNGQTFKVSFTQMPETIKEEKDIEVRSGLLDFKDKKIYFSLGKSELDKIRGAYVDVKVDETNLFGKLTLNLNGKNIFSDFIQPSGEERVYFNTSFLDEDNILTLTPAPSGWRFWASNVYKMDYVKIVVEKLGDIKKDFNFTTTQEQRDKFTLARLILKAQPVEGTGKIIIQINDKQIFREVPIPNQWIDFKNVPLYQNNIISFSSEEETEYEVTEATLIIFWKTLSEREVAKPLQVTSNAMNRLPGNIKFTIKKISGTPSSLGLKIRDANGDDHPLVIQGEYLKEGQKLSIEFTEDDVSIGSNYVIFTASGEGGFGISDYEVVF